MTESFLPKDEMADANYLEAVHLASFRLGLRPSDPQRHLDLLAALAWLRPDSIPFEHAQKLFDYFHATANFASSLATLFYLSRQEEALPKGLVPLISRFLKLFGPDGAEGQMVKPPKRTEQPDEEDPPYGSADEDEVVAQALKTWDDALPALFMPPPIQGRRVPLFQAMGTKSMELLLTHGIVRFIPSGETVIQEGEVDSSFYLLCNGSLEVYRKNETGRIRLGYLRPGSFFGEMSLVTSGPRNATITANETSVIIEINWDLLSSMLENDPSLADELARYTRFRLLKNLMATSPLFRTLSPDAKKDVIASFTPLIPEPGEKVISEGKKSPGLFLVASGEVRVISTKGKVETLLSTLGPGAVFGEISLIRDGAATATIEVGEEGVVLMQLTKSRFDQLAVLHPELLSHVYQVAIDRSQVTEKVKADDAIPAEDLVF